MKLSFFWLCLFFISNQIYAFDFTISKKTNQILHCHVLEPKCDFTKTQKVELRSEAMNSAEITARKSCISEGGEPLEGKIMWSKCRVNNSTVNYYECYASYSVLCVKH